jgi:hypothetical protein
MSSWIRCLNGNAVYTVGWKILAKTKRGPMHQVKCESRVHGFGGRGIALRVSCIMNCYVRGKQWICWYYLKVLKCLRENARRKKSQLSRSNSWFLHHDDAPAHALLLIHDFLANVKSTGLPQPLYSPDLATADVFLFPKSKSNLKGW